MLTTLFLSLVLQQPVGKPAQAPSKPELLHAPAKVEAAAQEKGGFLSKLRDRLKERREGKGERKGLLSRFRKGGCR